MEETEKSIDSSVAQESFFNSPKGKSRFESTTKLKFVSRQIFDELTSALINRFCVPTNLYKRSAYDYFIRRHSFYEVI